MVSYFGFDWIGGETLLKAANIPHNDELGDLKHFFIHVGWMPYYLEYRFNEESDLEFYDLIDYFYTDVELYMDLSDIFAAIRVPSAFHILQALQKGSALKEPVFFCGSFLQRQAKYFLFVRAYCKIKRETGARRGAAYVQPASGNTFIRVAETRSFNKATQGLFISPSEVIK
ncbi:MAG: hypothetical protein SPI25_06860 [Dialister sp.]|nr:hypothetical protein [Dialister sp.]